MKMNTFNGKHDYFKASSPMTYKLLYGISKPLKLQVFYPPWNFQRTELFQTAVEASSRTHCRPAVPRPAVLHRFLKDHQRDELDLYNAV